MTLQLGATIRVWLEHWKIYIKKMMKCMIACDCQDSGWIPAGLPKHYNIITTFTQSLHTRPLTSHSKYKILLPWQEQLHGLLYIIHLRLENLSAFRSGRDLCLYLDLFTSEEHTVGTRVKEALFFMELCTKTTLARRGQHMSVSGCGSETKQLDEEVPYSLATQGLPSVWGRQNLKC